MTKDTEVNQNIKEIILNIIMEIMVKKYEP